MSGTGLISVAKLSQESKGLGVFTRLASLCQKLGLTRSVRNKPRARSASIERRRRESQPEALKVLLRKTESLYIHIFLCADLECQFKEIITKNELFTAYFY